MSKYAGRVITDLAPAGYSVYFDGSGDYLTGPTNNAAFQFGTGDFTVEMWVNTANLAAYQTLLDTRSADTQSAWCLFLDNTGKPYWYDASGVQLSSTAVVANTWAHLAVSRSGSTLRMFLSGVQVFSGSNSNSQNPTGTFYVARNAVNAFLYTGYISNLRIVKGTALYTAAFTPPTQLLNVTNTSLLTCNSPAIVDQSSNAFAITVNGNSAVSTFTPFTAYVPYNPSLGASTPGVWTLDEAMQAAATRQWNMYDPYFQNTTLLLHGNGTNGAQNNTFLDSSSNNFTITRNGNTTQGSFSPFSQTGWSNYFDGTGDFLTAVGANLALGTGDFTIEFWFYAAAYSSSVDTSAMFDSRSGNNTTGFLIGPVFNNTNTLNVVQNTSPILTANTTYPLNIWVHCAVVRSSGTITLYQNGVSVGSVANTTNNTATTNYIASGYWQPSGSGQMFNGYLSNLRISNTARYTANFTPSASVFVSDSNTRLLACQSNRFLDSSSNAYPITPYGTPSVQAFSPFYPTAAYTPQTIGGSGYFDGTGDSLEIADNTAFTLDGDFTIEGWLYPFSVADSDNFIGKWQPSNQEYLFWPESGVPKFYWAPNSAVTALLISSVSIPTNAWTHLAVTRSGNSFTMWVNGVSRATATNSSAVTNTSSPVEIGRLSQYPPNYDYQGYMAGVRIVKGTAVYTTGFTPPTSPVTAITNTSLLLNFTNAGIIDNAMMNDLETVGNAQISTSVSKFGGGSMYFDGTGDWLISNVATTNLYAFGTGDFTIEMWIYFAALPASGGLTSLIDFRPNSTQGLYPTIYLDGTTKALRYFTNSADRISGSTALSATTWYHIAVARSGTSTKMFLNGTQEGSTYTDSNSYICGALRPVIATLGFALNNNNLNGYIDDLRITKGVARYTANFTPQTSQWQDQ